jgi:hyaluronan synthase
MSPAGRTARARADPDALLLAAARIEVIAKAAMRTAAGASSSAIDAEVPPSPVPAPRRRSDRVDIACRVVASIYLAALVALVIAYKATIVSSLGRNVAFGIYGVIAASYLLSRFFISLGYRNRPDVGYEPRVAIVMPGFNEEDAIARSLRSLLAVDYPPDKLELVAVNDGSTDSTLAEMEAVAAEAAGRVRVINFPENRGKRAAMAAGIRATDAEIVAFVDSDSVLEPDALRAIVQPLADPKIGAVCGHADVLNNDHGWMTKMQAVRYFVAFKVVKAAESVFGAVTCCSGCFSAYRRSAIAGRLDWWEHQTFLGMAATFGDDRSLTNCVLRDWQVVYQANAVSRTIVPATFKVFMRQQLRWKRSWTRESLIVGRFIWRKHPVAAISTYVGMVLPLIAPIVAVRALLVEPLLGGSGIPVIYPLGIYTMALVYGLYYVVRRPKYTARWVYGVLFVAFYLCFLVWQTYWAILTARTTSWGTRSATAGSVGTGV